MWLEAVELWWLIILYQQWWLVFVQFVLILAVAPPMNLKIRGVTDSSIDLEWEGSVLLTDFLLTYMPSSASGTYSAQLSLKQHLWTISHKFRQPQSGFFLLYLCMKVWKIELTFILSIFYNTTVVYLITSSSFKVKKPTIFPAPSGVSYYRSIVRISLNCWYVLIFFGRLGCCSWQTAGISWLPVDPAKDPANPVTVAAASTVLDYVQLCH